MVGKKLLLSLYYRPQMIWGVTPDDFVDPVERELWERLTQGEDIGSELTQWAVEINFDRSRAEQYARELICQSVDRQTTNLLSAMQSKQIDIAEGQTLLTALLTRKQFKDWAEFPDMYQAYQTPKRVVNLPWGIPWMDKFHPIDTNGLYVYFGNQGIGKTWFSLQLVMGWIRMGLTVSLVSLEMPREDLLKRLSILDDNPVWAKTHQPLTGDLKVWDELQICTPQTLESILVKSKPDVMVVDNLSAMKADTRSYSEHEGIASVIVDIKGLSRSTGIPFFCLAHSNRTSQQRKDKEPKITDVYGSSAIERFASGVYAAHHPAAVDEWYADKDEFMLYVLKDRNAEMLSPKGDKCQLLRMKNMNLVGGQVD